MTFGPHLAWSGALGRRHRRFGYRHRGCDDPNVVAIVEALGGWRTRCGAGLGWEAAHLALDHARVVPTAAALGGQGEDFEQDRLMHAAALPRGKRPHGRANAGGRCARRGPDPTPLSQAAIQVLVERAPD